MKTKKGGLYIILSNILLIAVLILTLSACFSDDEDTGGAGNGAVIPAQTPDSISLGLSQTSVKSDNSDSSTITATVLDNDNAVIEGITVTFSAEGGQISSSSVDTDANGQASITFSSGTSDRSNQIVTITATVEELDPSQIPVQVTGTTITLETDTANLTVNEDPATLTITLKDAGEISIYNAPVTLSLNPASTGAATWELSDGYTDYTTDVNGQLKVEVTGTSGGSATVTVESMGDTKTQSYTVGVAGAVFSITSPEDDPYSLYTNTDLIITVNAPDQQNVQFSTTIGAWDYGTEMVVTKTVSGVTAWAVLRSTSAGTATVQVFDADDASTTDSLKVAISAPSSEAAKIALQANATIVAPSTGELSNTITLTATVKNALDQVVGDAPVAFSIENPTGGGEYLSPTIAYTNDYGAANSTFTSGSLSSDAEGVTINASVVGMAGITDSISIVIGGTAGSVVIGQGTTIKSINEDTAYSFPMSVLVSDSNGNPVPGAVVSLSAWPTRYATGYWVKGEEECEPFKTGSFYNEDTNRNLILDPGEDTGTDPGHGDGELTPPNSAAGSLPSTVTTDENGVVNFDLVYLKSSAVWIEDEIAASTLVYGTETRSTINFWLYYAIGEECNLPDSPYNVAGQTKSITLIAQPDTLNADGADTSTIYAEVADDEGNPVPDGTEIDFDVKIGTGTVAPSTATTTGGMATATYTAPYIEGTETVTVTVRATAPNGISATVDIFLTHYTPPPPEP